MELVVEARSGRVDVDLVALRSLDASGRPELFRRNLVEAIRALRSPLMVGGHLPDTPPETLALLTNDSVLSLLDSDGSHELIRDNDPVVWSAAAGDIAWRAVFWLGDAGTSRQVHLADLGCRGPDHVEDAWTGHGVEIHDGAMTLDVPAHGVRLLHVR